MLGIMATIRITKMAYLNSHTGFELMLTAFDFPSGFSEREGREVCMGARVRTDIHSSGKPRSQLRRVHQWGLWHTDRSVPRVVRAHRLAHRVAGRTEAIGLQDRERVL